MIQVTLPGDDQTALTVVEGESHTITVSVPEPNLINVTISVTVSPDTAEKGIKELCIDSCTSKRKVLVLNKVVMSIVY